MAMESEAKREKGEDGQPRLMMTARGLVGEMTKTPSGDANTTPLHLAKSGAEVRSVRCVCNVT
ncbi:polyketide synthase [Sesbania bispinosa]|nr:polyketide synthase [Sesbania bispinosa]